MAESSCARARALRGAVAWLMAAVSLMVLAACNSPAPAPTVEPVVDGPFAEVGKLTVDVPGPVAVTRADLRAIGWGDVPLDQVHLFEKSEEGATIRSAGRWPLEYRAGLQRVAAARS